MSKDKKFAMINASYKKLVVPVDFLPKLLDVAILVETSYEDGRDRVCGVHDIEKIELVSGLEIDQAIAEEKLRS